MKKVLTTLALGLLSTGAFAQNTGAVSYTDEYIVVDLTKACYQRGKADMCDLASEGISMKMVGTAAISDRTGAPAKSKIVSEIPVGKVEYGYSYNDNEVGTWQGNRMFGKSLSSARSQDFGQPGVNEVIFDTDYGVYPTRVFLRTGIPSYLKDGLGGASRLLRSSYAGVLRNLQVFKTEIAKSHRSHLDRLLNSIQDGIALLDMNDKTGKPLYSILDWRIQENARLVVVFGSVLDELLTDYDDVERLKISIKAMRTLVSQLRDSYGWDKGLAGSVSKASSSLIEVMRLELQELASIKMAMGSGDFQIYLDLLKTTRTLQAKVDASKSGDMKAQREIFTLVDQWNAKPWQDELGRLMNAGPDFKNLVVPKLSMLLFAVESVADLSQQDFILPDRTLLNK